MGVQFMEFGTQLKNGFKNLQDVDFLSCNAIAICLEDQVISQIQDMRQRQFFRVQSHTHPHGENRRQLFAPAD